MGDQVSMIALLTYYVDTCTASGKHCGGSNIAAPRRFAFGTRIEFTAADGRKVIGVVADRGAKIHGDRFDLPPAMFARVAGRGWRKKGVARVKARVLRAKKGAEHGNH